MLIGQKMMKAWKIPAAAGAIYGAIYIVLTILCLLNVLGGGWGTKVVFLINPLVYIVAFIYSMKNVFYDVMFIALFGVISVLIAALVCKVTCLLYRANAALVAIPIALYLLWAWTILR